MSGERVVIIAMDGSRYADYAFNFYLSCIRQYRDHVILVYSIETVQVATASMGVGDANFVATMMSEEKQKAQRYIHHLTLLMKESRVKGKVKQVFGSPGEALVRLATEENAHLLITGTRGLGTLRRTMLGSVSDFLLHHSPVPVIICRNKNLHGLQRSVSLDQ